jgi:transcriptional regulator with XRE-family HTH domain
MRIAELRKKKRLTQKQLADHLGIDQTAVSHWENGDIYPNTVNQHKLSQLFNVSVDYLLGRTDEEIRVPLDSGTSNIDLIQYAAVNGLTPGDLKEFIDFVKRLKEKDA